MPKRAEEVSIIYICVYKHTSIFVHGPGLKKNYMSKYENHTYPIGYGLQFICLVADSRCNDVAGKQWVVTMAPAHSLSFLFLSITLLVVAHSLPGLGLTSLSLFHFQSCLSRILGERGFPAVSSLLNPLSFMRKSRTVCFIMIKRISTDPT